MVDRVDRNPINYASWLWWHLVTERVKVHEQHRDAQDAHLRLLDYLVPLLSELLAGGSRAEVPVHGLGLADRLLHRVQDKLLQLL